MATVSLNFIPPIEDNWTTLHIYESPTQTGTYTEIETVPVSVPYITDYETTHATDASHWFSIRWSDGHGLFTDYSQAVQGGTRTLVGEIIERVQLRDPSLDENVIAQEAAAAVEEVYPAEDAYSVLLNGIKYKTLTGLTLLTMARCYITDFLKTQSSGGTVDSFTAGLISVKSGSTTSSSSTNSLKSIQAILDEAAKLLAGTSASVVLQMEELPVAGGMAMQLVAVDISRSIVELE